jgi:hypothetical protein
MQHQAESNEHNAFISGIPYGGGAHPEHFCRLGKEFRRENKNSMVQGL